LRRLDTERRDVLQLSIVVKLKVLFLEVWYDFALRIAHHRAHEHQVYAHFESGRSVVAGNFFTLARCGRWRGYGRRVRLSGGILSLRRRRGRLSRKHGGPDR